MKTEQRFQRRSLCADLVKIELVNERGVKQTVAAVLEDISARGVCLQLECPVDVHAAVTVLHGNDWSARGFITYCNFREIGYFIGIEFEENASWSTSVFLPQHLLALEDLMAG